MADANIPFRTPRLHPKLVSFSQDLLFGGISASIAKTIVAPIERVKIMLQVQDAHVGMIKEQRYSGIIDAITRIPKEQGFVSFWRGNGTNLIRYFPTQAINFACKDQYKAIFMPKPGQQVSKFEYTLRNMACGGAAGATSLLVVFPLDLARTRLTSDITKLGNARKYNGLADCLSKTFKNEGGIRALYRGFGIGLVGIVPYRAVYFGIYDSAKAFMLQDPANAPFWQKWAISQSVTVVAQLVVYPCDTLRRRMQLAAGGEERIYTSTWDCMKKIFRNEGARGFYKGSLANSFRATGGALCLVFYDEVQRIFAPERVTGEPPTFS